MIRRGASRTGIVSSGAVVVGAWVLLGGLAVLACNTEGATPNCADPAVGCGPAPAPAAEAAADAPAATDAARETGSTDAGTDTSTDTGVDAPADARDE
jgi:hypothetical protein